MNNLTKIHTKKGQLNNILGMLFTGGIMLTIIVVAIAIGAEITTDIRDDNAVASSAFNVSNNGLAGLGNLSGQLGIIGTVIALTVVLLILIALLFKQFTGGIK